MTKKAELKRLCSVPSGIVPSMKYEMLQEAKKFALKNDLEFPTESQTELTIAAKQTLGLAVDFVLGNGSFK